MMHSTQKHTQDNGYIVISVLVFAGIFILILASLIGFIFIQNRTTDIKSARESALQIAEAGLNYYGWYLAHYPDDLTNGTGETGPYTIDYEGPEGDVHGTYELTINGNTACGDTTSVNITSEGWTDEHPDFSRTIFGKYARPSVAAYAYIINNNVWAGESREIQGPYHSNGGIRMDGESDSLVTSAVEEWECTSSFGCDPDETKPGVFGDGEIQALWQYPAPSIDFAGITLDLADMKSDAQSSGVYFGQVSSDNRRGYHLIFKNDGTFDMYEVTDTSYVWGYHIDDNDWHRDYHIIDDEEYLGNYDIPGDCSLIFIEDKVWIEGEVYAKTTVAAADISGSSFDPDVIISGNIDYGNKDGSHGLTVVGERSVLIPLASPDDLEIRGIFIAQKGYFGRNYYPESWYPTYAKREHLEVVGSIVSDGRVGTSWTCSGEFCSGYEERENRYDRNLTTDPPPMTPYTSDEFDFVQWREERE